ncbi:MAG: acyl-CoA dehydratase activase-related protein [candidate division WOR-3 bacterium]|nr:acyl-CoA dehydratase activase-related protein [candidate division WOR-3 bacterium]
MARRIGICRALHAYHHFAFWRTFFTEMGWEVVLSEPTSRPVLELGVRLSPAELCLPVKAFLGHVAALKDRVDALFLPRIVCTRVAGDWFFGCPKAIALPDLTRAVFDSLPLIVEPVLDKQILTEEQSFRNAIPGRNSRSHVRKALRLANAAATDAALRTRAEGLPLHMFSDQGTKGEGQRTGDGRPAVRVGVVGHSYLLFDSGLNLGVLDKVREAGAEPTVVFPTAVEVEMESTRDNALNWYYELELLAAAHRLLEVERVDGLLLVASFACGTGAVTNELIQRAAVHRHGVPTVMLLMDEHTGEAGIVTRIESFVDLLRLRKR